MGETKRLDYFDPGFIAAIITAVSSDAVLLFAGVILLIPVIGLVIAGLAILFHYFASVFILMSVLFRLKHFLPKLVLGIAIILPLPLLVVGIFIALILQNRLIELILIETVTKTLEAAEVGTGVGTPLAAATEAAGKAAEGVGVVAKGAEAAKAVGTVVKEGAREGAKKWAREKAGEKIGAGETHREEENEGEDLRLREALGEERPILGAEGALEQRLFEPPANDNGDNAQNGTPMGGKGYIMNNNQIDLRPAANDNENEEDIVA
ncbi:MAG: hypothetical protein V1489_00760 [Candidatus Liptonbacteria bacterium]